MYKRVSLFVIIIVLSLFVLSGCDSDVDNSEKGRKDIIEIYNANNEKVLETQDQKVLDYISNLIGMSTENIDEKNYKDFLKELPKDAKVRYHYVFITICIIISVTSFQKILKNFRDKEYFSKDNSKYAKEILISIIILILCKFLAQVSFNYLHITDVSMIYDLSVKDYLFNIFFGIIAFISIILFKNGKKLKDDSESII